MENLTTTQRKHLRSLAHHLKPVITIGVKGLTDAVVEETQRALEHHQLMKIKVVSDNREQRNALILDLCSRIEATLVAKIGMTATLYRPDPDEPRITLPL